MSAAKCQRCGRYWSFSCNPDLFQVITKLCPLCIAKALPVAGAAQ
ncbi:hypothetical protein CL81_gp45 [Mycobacterium phage Charlie]|uniref:Uncharacterized protein n=1 Tax=Mycobacterium phage Charlie TaxID=1056830 RepID=G1FTY3_9CAUD|nr:hypothetical protein CL81_gp45 [Mycobacterium phage Charlie]AEL19967.1 hypothetical protein CHARLIE_45 [Mycobacterium phage Charlie]